MKDLVGIGTRTATRIVALAAMMSLAILLGGCQPYVGLFIHNSYPFAVSIIKPYTDIQNKPQLWNCGIVLPGQQKKMTPGLSRSEAAHLEVRNLHGVIVRQIRISQNQLNRMYMASKEDVSAVYINVGPGQATVIYRDDPQLLSYNRAMDRALILVFLVPIAAVFIICLARHWRSRQKALETMR